MLHLQYIGLLNTDRQRKGPVQLNGTLLAVLQLVQRSVISNTGVRTGRLPDSYWIMVVDLPLTF
jgi:hypothetical protein